MTQKRVVIRQLPTGVPGLDAVLGGGIPEYSFNLVAGEPGGGKTTLAHQVMFANATPECPASGFELALAPTFRTDFRESLYRLVGALTGVGITVLTTMEIMQDRAELRFTPNVVSFLADVLLLLRYCESEGQIKKVMTVAKMRGSQHSKAFREYDITGHGSRVRGGRRPGRVPREHQRGAVPHGIGGVAGIPENGTGGAPALSRPGGWIVSEFRVDATPFPLPADCR